MPAEVGLLWVPPLPAGHEPGSSSTYIQESQLPCAPGVEEAKTAGQLGGVLQLLRSAAVVVVAEAALPVPGLQSDPAAAAWLRFSKDKTVRAGACQEPEVLGFVGLRDTVHRPKGNRPEPERRRRYERP